MNEQELLNEAISDKTLTAIRNKQQRERLLDNMGVIAEMAKIATTAVMESAANGNVRCGTAAILLFQLQKKLK